jgi:hypothetical protein
LATFEESLELAGLIEVLLHRTTEIIEADVFEVRGSLAQGGVLRVSLKGEPLLAGDQFQLFRAQSITGQFQAVELPELTEGVRWDLTSLGSHGLLRVVAAAAVPQVASVRSNASGELELEIPTAVGQTYELQETGSLGASSDWRTLSAHAGNGLSLKLTVPFDASRPSRFFRFKID